MPFKKSCDWIKAGEDPAAFPEVPGYHPLAQVKSRFYLESTGSMPGNFVIEFSNARLQ